MSYHIYTTKGIVLSMRPIHEADRIYSILTRDLGLIRARAISVRKGASKLRGSIEPYSIANVSLVRGKEFWRLTSVEHIKKVLVNPAIAKPLALLEKLVQGEAQHVELFDVVEKYMLEEKVRDEDFEIEFVSNVLYELGYIKKEDLALPKKEIIKAINEGLQNSHLA